MPDQKKSRRRLLEEFIVKTPGDAFSLYGLALECSNTGDIPAADTHFRALHDRHPEYIPAYLMYAQMLVRASRPADAKEVLSKGIAEAAKKGDAHARSEMEALLAEL
jgi:predicted Zn-dependent protease